MCHLTRRTLQLRADLGGRRLAQETSMSLRSSLVCWIATLCVSACGVDGMSMPDGGDVVREPCAGKACGAACRLCAPDDAKCIENDLAKFCQADSSCAPTQP